MPIRDLHVTNIGPFDDMTFEFDEHVNVFVGPNSSGKSTTLMTLANIATYPFTLPAAISGDLLSAVISIRYFLGFRKDNPNVFNMLVQDLPIASGIKCICC